MPRLRTPGTRALIGAAMLLLALPLFIGRAAGLSPGAVAQSGSGEGLFTADQAARGKVVYEQSCAACHGAALTGGSARALVGNAFRGDWGRPGLTVDDLFYIVRTTMPPKQSGTLPLDDHASATAYLLQANGYRPGTTALARGAPGLKQPFEWAKAGPPAPAPPPGPEVLPADPGAAPGVAGPDQAALTAAAESTDWLLHAHDYSGTRFSPLTQLTPANASRLAPACLFQVGERDSFQTVPLVHRGTIFLTTSWSTIAIDARDCRVKWRSAWPAPFDLGRSRGAAIKDGRLVRGTPDGFLVALSTETGARLWARRVATLAAGEIFTMAPIIYDDLVIIGPGVSEFNVKGWVGAFKLSDGSPVWRFNTIPQPGEPGFETWHNPSNIPMGGGGVWTSFALDPATGDLFVAVANPAPDLPAQHRLGDNLYTNAVVVLDVRTGKRRWHRSLVPNDSHDWDLTHAMPLFTVNINGIERRIVTTAGKDGVLRALDRTTREFLYETPVTTRENAEVAVTTSPTRACPGVLGGVQWSGPSFNRATGMLYVPAVDWCATFTAFSEPRYIPYREYMGGTVDLDPPDKAQGWLTAIDARSGAVRWKYRSPRPMVAGVTSTAGGLVFTGELTGHFLTLDARTGKVLYRFNTGGSMGGGVVTYAVDGKQYIAVASGTPSSFWVNKNGGAPTIVIFTITN
jgi:alcohol dehydrogenase (cytochrome c)